MKYLLTCLLGLLLLSSNPVLANEKYDGDKKVDEVIDLVLQAEVEGLLPQGALDGPKETDIMYKMAVTTLGAPVVKATERFQNNHSNDSAGYTSVAYFGSFMSGLALIVTAVLMLFVAFGGLVNTAADGKFLGEKWDSMYVPMRTGFGISALYPTKAFGGLSLVQVITIGLALLGIGIASTIFAWVSKSMLTTPIVLPNIPSHAQIAKHMFEGQLCQLLEEKYATGQGPNIVLSKKLSRLSSADGEIKKGYKTNLMFGSNNCGGLSVNAKPINSDLIDLHVSVQLGTVMNEVTINSLYAMWDDLLPLSNKLFDDFSNRADASIDYTNVAADFASALAAHEMRLRSVFSNNQIQSLLEQSSESLVEDATRLGFVMAGTYYYTWARNQDQMNEVVENNVPVIIKPSVNIVDSLISTVNGYTEHSIRISSRLSAVYRSVGEVNDLDAAIAAHVDEQQTTLGSWLSTASAKFAQAITNVGRSGSSSHLNPDPILELKSMGNIIINTYVGMLAATSVIDAGGNSIIANVVTLGGASAIGKIASNLFHLLATWSIPVLAIGFIYANLLPALPYIMWTTAAAGYLIYLIEAVYSSPFWMAMHITPDGHEITGKGASGYPILLTLILRPSFMIGGLLAAMGIVRVMGWFINQTLFESMRNMGVGTFNSTSALGMILIYGISMAAIIYKAFSLTHELPNAMLRWMGVGQHHADLGEAQAMERSNTAIAAIGGSVRPGGKPSASVGSEGISSSSDDAEGGHSSDNKGDKDLTSQNQKKATDGIIEE